MSHKSKRQVGGQNNKQGNRYEELFAVQQLIKLAEDWIVRQALSRMKEQVHFPVDDLLIQAGDGDGYHQLKSGHRISWTQNGGKLEKEFSKQKRICARLKRSFHLYLVVANMTQKDRLIESMPRRLGTDASVVFFPLLTRPAELARRPDDLRSSLAAISASRYSSETEFENLALAFHSAWLNHSPDSQGFCETREVVRQVRDRGIGRLRGSWSNPTSDWPEARNILNRIANFRWWVDRGYFEWEFAMTDRALFLEPCDSDSFARFLRRVVTHRPETFEALEELFP